MFENVDDVVIPGFSGVELRAEDFPTNFPKPQPRRPPTPHITVHQYTHGSQRSLRSSPLSVGRRVAEMATAVSGWYTINSPAFELLYRDDRSFFYAPPVPVLMSDALLTHEKEWGEPPSPDEIFSVMDLDEFVVTDFSYLHFLVPSNRYPESHAVSQYDPYAGTYSSGVQHMSHVPFAFHGSDPRGAQGATSPDPSMIPGFALEVSSMNYDAKTYEEAHRKPTTDPRPERDHLSGSSSDADLYGSAPHNLSPPRGLDHSKSSQAEDHRDRQPIRKYDTSTLMYVIPEPHFHPAPSADLSVARRSRIPPFSKSIPIPIFPCTDTSVEIYLQTPHGRGSWIIPVRGVLPWDGCTRARILQPNPTPNAYPPKQSFEGYTDLVWTHASLVEFWNFLCKLNEVETLGNMGISFHADTSFSDDNPAYNDSVEYEPTPPDVSLFDTESSDPRISLLLVDHIKIYCDVEFAMNIRTVLASWQYQWDEKNAVEDAFDFDPSGSQASEIALYGKESQQFQVRKIQLLHGARIPFLDHRNNGLFVS